MVIEILEQKYKCGCGKGKSELVAPDLLSKINNLLEWDFCRFPKAKKVVEKVEYPKFDEEGKEVPGEVEEIEEEFFLEDRDFLGEKPELKPGNCFLYRGQVVAVDAEDRLVLVISETGNGALKRLKEEVIDPEYWLVYEAEQAEDLTWQELEVDPPIEFDGVREVEYFVWKNFRDKFVAGRDYKFPFLIHLEDSSFPEPVDLIFNDWNVSYNSEMFDEEDGDMVDLAIEKALAWFESNYERKVTPLSPDLLATVEQQKKAKIKKWIKEKKKEG